MFAGDEPCSSRFYDALALDVINIVISDGFQSCLIGRHVIGEWDQMFLQVPEQDFLSDPYKAVNAVLAQYNETDFERMLQRIDRWKPSILWDVVNSTADQTLLQDALAKCVTH
mmetsp:Transcript_73800/g.117672  ORF Transcript_73800/g.117672 Transcript_73800/m.117672 type:complete len:113 (-) Transcript_73800:22-360(-)